MNKIKILAIIILTLIGIFGFFISLMDLWFWSDFLFLGLGLITFVLLNIQSFKVGGLIKKLVVYADIVALASILLAFVPFQPVNVYIFTHYIVCFLCLIFSGLIITILVESSQNLDNR